MFFAKQSKDKKFPMMRGIKAVACDVLFKVAIKMSGLATIKVASHVLVVLRGHCFRIVVPIQEKPKCQEIRAHIKDA